MSVANACTGGATHSKRRSCLQPKTSIGGWAESRGDQVSACGFGIGLVRPECEVERLARTAGDCDAAHLNASTPLVHVPDATLRVLICRNSRRTPRLRLYGSSLFSH